MPSGRRTMSFVMQEEGLFRRLREVRRGEPHNGCSELQLPYRGLSLRAPAVTSPQRMTPTSPLVAEKQRLPFQERTDLPSAGIGTAVPRTFTVLFMHILRLRPTADLHLTSWERCDREICLAARCLKFVVLS